MPSVRMNENNVLPLAVELLPNEEPMKSAEPAQKALTLLYTTSAALSKRFKTVYITIFIENQNEKQVLIARQ